MYELNNLVSIFRIASLTTQDVLGLLRCDGRTHRINSGPVHWRSKSIRILPSRAAGMALNSRLSGSGIWTDG